MDSNSYSVLNSSQSALIGPRHAMLYSVLYLGLWQATDKLLISYGTLLIMAYSLSWLHSKRQPISHLLNAAATDMVVS